MTPDEAAEELAVKDVWDTLDKGFRQGAEAMREAAARECDYLRDGAKMCRSFNLSINQRRRMEFVVETCGRAAKAIRALKLEDLK